MERDNLVADKIKAIDHFNSHAHVERDEFNLVSESWIFNFNSHAHVERDGEMLWYMSGKSISTHTLTWSVTLLVCLCCYISGISTHTLTWSVTEKYFGVNVIATISTHTLTWSVTFVFSETL